MTHQGYSTKLVRANNEANINNIGVRLGYVCIIRDISVVDIARKFGVSRQTIYNWFTGRVTPPPKAEAKIRQFIEELNREWF